MYQVADACTVQSDQKSLKLFNFPTTDEYGHEFMGEMEQNPAYTKH